MDNEDRRKQDEQFRIRIIEQLSESKTLLLQGKESLRNIEAQLGEHGLRIKEIQQTLWGGPGIGDVGLLELHRKTVRNWAIFIWIGVFILSAVGHIIAPLYNAAVDKWAFNSVGEKWAREQKRPRVRKYIINETPPPSVEP
jgi:hypothetical protein